MKIDPALQVYIMTAFAPLNDEAAAAAFPPPASFWRIANRRLTGSKGIETKNLSQDVAKMFTTAAVDIWMRSVHSFLVSASLT